MARKLIATWSTKKEYRATNNDEDATEALLRSGIKGKGEILGRFIYWQDAPLSVAASSTVAANIAQDAQRRGYEIHGLWNPHEGSSHDHAGRSRRYYAEIEAGKQRTPSTQEEAFAKTVRQEDEQARPWQAEPCI